MRTHYWRLGVAGACSRSACSIPPKTVPCSSALHLSHGHSAAPRQHFRRDGLSDTVLSCVGIRLQFHPDPSTTAARTGPAAWDLIPSMPECTALTCSLLGTCAGARWSLGGPPRTGPPGLVLVATLSTQPAVQGCAAALYVLRFLGWPL